MNVTRFKLNSFLGRFQVSRTRKSCSKDWTDIWRQDRRRYPSEKTTEEKKEKGNAQPWSCVKIKPNCEKENCFKIKRKVRITQQMYKKAWMVEKLKKITIHNAPRSEDLRYNYGWETKFQCHWRLWFFHLQKISLLTFCSQSQRRSHCHSDQVWRQC